MTARTRSRSVGIILEDILTELRRINPEMLGMEDKWVSITDAAEVLGKTRQTINTYVRKGYLVPVYRCGQKGFRLADVKKLSR